MKIFHNTITALTTVILLLLMIQIMSPNIFVNGQTYNTTLESQFGNTSKTELIHDGAMIILNQTTQKLSYKMGENITVNTELVNVGNKAVDIAYCEPWVAFEIKSQVGDEIWPKSQLACIPEFSSKKTLQPGEHFVVQPWGSRSGNVISPPSSDNPGTYSVISVAVFTFNTSPGGLSSAEPVWSKPLQITVLPEKYIENKDDSSITKAPEFPFALPMLLVGITSLILLYRIKFKTSIT